MLKDEQPIPLPMVAARYLVEWLSELGWAESGGMASIPLSALEIKAWSEMKEIRLEPWEFDCLRQASRAYVVQTHSDHPAAPWVDEEDKPKIKAALFGRLKSIAAQINRD